LFSIPEFSYIAGNGFVFNLTITPFSETLKNITCRIIAPLLIVNGAFEFSASFLVGYEENTPVFCIQEVAIEYVA
jgi:hypothetical protein